MHDAPVVRFLLNSAVRFLTAFFAFSPPRGCDVSFLAKPEKRIVP